MRQNARKHFKTQAVHQRRVGVGTEKNGMASCATHTGAPNAVMPGRTFTVRQISPTQRVDSIEKAPSQDGALYVKV